MCNKIGGIFVLENILEIVENEIRENETINWYDKPQAKKINAEGIIMTIFGCIFVGFSMFWTLSQIGPKSPFNDPFFTQSLIDRMFPYFSLPFFIIGLLLLPGPYWIYKRMLNTIYAITNERCIIITVGRTKKVQSYNIYEIRNIEKTEYSDGTGDICFAKETALSSRDEHGNRTIRTIQIGFNRIQNVTEVEHILRKIVKS